MDWRKETVERNGIIVNNVQAVPRKFIFYLYIILWRINLLWEKKHFKEFSAFRKSGKSLFMNIMNLFIRWIKTVVGTIPSSLKRSAKIKSPRRYLPILQSHAVLSVSDIPTDLQRACWPERRRDGSSSTCASSSPCAESYNQCFCISRIHVTEN